MRIVYATVVVADNPQISLSSFDVYRKIVVKLLLFRPDGEQTEHVDRSDVGVFRDGSEASSTTDQATFIT